MFSGRSDSARRATTRGGAGEACRSRASDRRQHGPLFLRNGLGLDGQGVADPALREMTSAEGCQMILRAGLQPEGPRQAGSVSAANKARSASADAPVGLLPRILPRQPVLLHRPFRTVRRLRMQVPRHSSTALLSRAMHPPPPSQGLHQKAPIGAVKRWRKQCHSRRLPN